ncbi:MAG TPA: lyase family protein [Kofleriaceae bacterium]|nr:lyase family protein [Kofleriaceae bacterium]
MEHTGRLQQSVTDLARRILFGATADAAIDADLGYIVEVDRAHLVMLAERGLLPAAHARALLAAIAALTASGFAPLRGQPAPRGLYLLYEDHLIRALGPEVGGMLQIGRSRNDLGATIFRLRLRAPVLALLGEAQRLLAILVRRAERYQGTCMPAYTHYQAAVPISYGHYLAGVACALARDTDGLAATLDELDTCALGAGAVGGTTLPIDAARTAALLGFRRPVAHSIDAVASRDLALRLLAGAAILGVTLSRAATDLLLWTSGELGLLWLPDHLVGSSSMMPQKRNAFLLEHVQGRSTAALGALVGAAAAMHAKPFTNSIAVGTEGVAPLEGALRATREASILLRLVIAGARPEPAAMAARAAAGYTTATELANRLVATGELSFRSAHHAVGALVRDAIARGEPLEQAALDWPLAGAADLGGLDPASVARASAYGGGPGDRAMDACLGQLRAGWRARAAAIALRRRNWQAAAEALDAEVTRLLGAPAPDRASAGADSPRERESSP